MMRLLRWMMTGEGGLASLLRWAIGEGKWVTITVGFLFFDFAFTYILLTFFHDWFFEGAPQTYLLIQYFGIKVAFFVIVPIAAILFFILTRAFWHLKGIRITVYVLCAIKLALILWGIGVFFYALFVYLSESSLASS